MTSAVPTVIHAEIELAMCTGEICVNGIPVMSCPEVMPSFSQSILVNQFVVPHENVLELAVDLDPEAPSLCRRVRDHDPAPVATASARLVRYRVEPGSFADPEEGEVLATITWSAAQDSSRRSPRELRASIDLGAAYGRWSWQDAPAITLDDGTRQEAIMLLEEIRAAFRAGHTDRLLDLIAIKFREVARAFPGSANDAEDRARLGAWLAGFAREPERVLPLDLAALDLRLAAENRVLVPMTRRWTSALELRVPMPDQDGNLVGDVDVPYDVMLARIDGRLRVVR